jgi:hypothetical protein
MTVGIEVNVEWSLVNGECAAAESQAALFNSYLLERCDHTSKQRHSLLTIRHSPEPALVSAQADPYADGPRALIAISTALPSR